jgi:CPA2 family monovalent cation:H+ antiporter-2
VLDLFFNFFLIFILLYLLGFDYFVAFAIAGISYASSSAITTKIIIDEHRIANIETEFILGLMVFEDIIAPIMVAFISAFAVGSTSGLTLSIWIFAKIFVVIGVSIFIAVFVRKILAGFIDKYLKDEVLTLLVIGFVVLASGITKYIGLSEALGAFLVGIIVSESGKSYQVESLIIPIRDITVAYFFLIFGSSISFAYLSNFGNLWIFALLIVISIVGKILTGVIGGKIYGLSKKKSLISGLGIVNRGEFSIAMSQYLTLSISPIISIYIFLLALIGILFSQYSNFISGIFYKKKNRPPKTSIT